VPALLLHLVLPGSNQDATAAAAGAGAAGGAFQQVLEQSCCAAVKAAYHKSTCNAAVPPGTASRSSGSSTSGMQRQKAARELVCEMLHTSNHVAAQALAAASCGHITETAVAVAAAAVCNPSSSNKLLIELTGVLQQLCSTELPAAVWDELWKLLQQKQLQQDESGVDDAGPAIPGALSALRQLLTLLQDAPASALQAVLSCRASSAPAAAAADAAVGARHTVLSVLLQVLSVQLELMQLERTELSLVHQHQQQQQQQRSLQDFERPQVVDELVPALNAALAAALACIGSQAAVRELLLQLAAAVTAVLQVLLLPDDQLLCVLQPVGGGFRQLLNGARHVPLWHEVAC
jgi:hypothetical protein